jgi:hypothetical protein
MTSRRKQKRTGRNIVTARLGQKVHKPGAEPEPAGAE